MESKHPAPTGLKSKSPPQPNAMGELSTRLSDIEMKLDHLIDRIKDSLHHLHTSEKDDWEDAP